jgi:hypothetical protein
VVDLTIKDRGKANTTLTVGHRQQTIFPPGVGTDDADH